MSSPRPYRGLRVDNGKWTYGCFFQIWEKTYILWGTTNGIPDMVEVIPETVGQSIGLKDKNGVEICEGDICTYTSTGFVGEVKYYCHPDTCAFNLWGTEAAGIHGLHMTSDLEVIGNIHTTPQLMEQT